MVFIAIVVGLLILLYVVEIIADKILSVEKKKVSETSGRHIDRWGKSILFIFFLVLLWFMVDSPDILRLFYFIIYLALLFGYQAVIAFIFIKESRQYISKTILLIIIVVILLSFAWVDFPNK